MWKYSSFHVHNFEKEIIPTGAGRMSQQVKAFASKPEFDPEVEGKNGLPQTVT